MSTADVDSRGRIYLPKDMREKHGEKFKIVELESGIKLIPLDEDPIEGLKDATEGAEELKPREISEKVKEKASEEIEEEF